MSYLTVVRPEEIEPELKRTWESLAKTNKTRACLFNLIVYAHLNPRSDFIRIRVQKIIEKFPCRILFISHDLNSKKDYLKTAISVVSPKEEDSHTACDQIDIGVSGKDIAKVPFVVLPLLLPDLPVHLLWAEDPCNEDPLFQKLASFSSRLIFDSETSEHLYLFASTLLSFHEKGKEIADLNWARTESWRDLIAASFFSEERLSQLENASSIKIEYNAEETPFFCHFKIQALYLQAWLASRLKWEWEKVKIKKGDTYIQYSKSAFLLAPTKRQDLMAAGIVSLTLETENKEVFHFHRSKENPHEVIVEIASSEKCDLPYHFILGKDLSGLSLIKEITYKGTSEHYLDALRTVTHIQNPKIC